MVQTPGTAPAANPSKVAPLEEPRGDSGSPKATAAAPDIPHASPRSYEWVRNHLYTLARDCSPSTKAENLSLIGMLGRPDNITAVLRRVMDDKALLSEIANRSYHHTNHFDKIVLVDTGNQLGYRLTMHLWNPPYTEFEVNDEQIHDHRFSFWSNILVGKIVFQNYVRDASGVMFREYQYIPERLGVSTVGNYYIDVGESPLLEAEPSGWNAGEFYHLSYNQIHRVVLPRAEMSCTLVLRGPRQKNYASVFSNSQKYDPTGNTMFTPKSLADKLAVLVDGINNAERGEG
jgi:hypothetical protein